MKKIRSVFTALAIVICSQIMAQQRVVVIGLDGFGTEGFKGSRHPNIDTLLAEGTYSLTTRPVMPSVTMPNWTSHLTGSGPEEHGVTYNDWRIDNIKLQPLEKDAEGFYPSIFKVLKDQDPNTKTAFYYNWAELINSFNKKYIDELSFEEKDGYEGNYQKAADFLINNRHHPSLVFLYTVHTDIAGHEHKWMSPQYIHAIEAADTVIGKFLDRLKAADLYKSTHFILITDHGGIEKSHGGVSMNEMQVPWGIAGPQIKKQGLKEFFNSNKNTAHAIARIFKVKAKNIPASWSGKLPDGIFK